MLVRKLSLILPLTILTAQLRQCEILRARLSVNLMVSDTLASFSLKPLSVDLGEPSIQDPFLLLQPSFLQY